ncbi:hypothetical protein GSI_07620 [Ganoderma sinense ZZ0214-1]|uniref:Uncharacterized protein n=1 Tax=Ganoderma sinense ZZ0214-1 TaxID=1077348 RepID=A0A2G8S9I3_9APHY|nr:hypothetical protein GSI_07620 [Ganoderma sinense ZZ0214-1]
MHAPHNAPPSPPPFPPPSPRRDAAGRLVPLSQPPACPPPATRHATSTGIVCDICRDPHPTTKHLAVANRKAKKAAKAAAKAAEPSTTSDPAPAPSPPAPLPAPAAVPACPAPTNPDPAPQPQRREELRQPVQRSGLRWADTLLPHNGPRPWVSRLPTGHDTCRQYRLPDPVPLHLRPATTALKDHLLASSFPVRDVHWGTSGRVLSVVPTSTLSAADVHRLDDRVRTLLAQPGITSTPYLYKSQLSVPNLQSYECLPGGDTRPIDPRAFLLTAARRSPTPAARP